MSNARDRDKAKLILLIGDVMAARRQNDPGGAQAATAALQDFSENTAFPNLATKASVTISVNAIADMEEGLSRLADIADQLSPLRQAFQAGAEIADEGKSSLFFPRVASTLVQVEELLNSVLATATSFKDDIASVKDDFDIEKLKALIEKIRNTGDELSQKLDEISA